MRQFARQQTAALLDRLEAVVDRAAHSGDAEAIHDVRVCMRRVSCCLRVFAPLYPDRHWKKIHRRIGRLMSAAGAVRDCDIAIELAGRCGMAPRHAIVTRLAARRDQAGRALLAEIRRWRRHDYPRQWRRRLGV